MKKVLYFVACVTAAVVSAPLFAAESSAATCDAQLQQARSVLASSQTKLTAGESGISTDELMMDQVHALANLQKVKLACSGISAQDTDHTRILALPSLKTK